MFKVFCGSKEAMEAIAQQGVKGLNPKTMKWEIIDKKAKYQVIEDSCDKCISKGECISKCATLYSDRDLRIFAKQKGLAI